MDIEDIEVFVGIDVGKTHHWATALTKGGKKVFDKALPNDEARLRALYEKPAAHGHLLVVVDQPATIVALAVAVARDMGAAVGRPPGLTGAPHRRPDTGQRQDRREGRGRDRRRRPHHAPHPESHRHLGRGRRGAEHADRFRPGPGQTGQPDRQPDPGPVHPDPPRPGGHPGTSAGARRRPGRPVAAWPTPTALRKAGRARIDAKLKKHGARRHAAWAGRIVSALGRQTVTVTGTEAAGTVLPHLARQLIAPRSQRADVAARVETLVRAHPLHEVLTSMPGVGVGTAAVFLAETLGKTFDTGARPASYAGLTPVTRRSGSSIRGERVCRTGNKRLKHAMFPSALASLRDPVSRTYYQRKRDQGKRHNQALLALAHRRILTLHAMIRDAALYDPQPATKPHAAA